MKDAGRLAPDTLISADRQEWRPISVLGGAFAQFEMALATDGLPVPDTNGQGPHFFIHLDGQIIGPFGSHSLQERVLAGALGPTDPVWMQGSQSWLPAARMPGLAFPVQRVPLPVWLKKNAIVLAAIASAVLALIIAPSWYVLAINAHREAKINDQKNQLLELGVELGKAAIKARDSDK
jgi:hypothetical protein